MKPVAVVICNYNKSRYVLDCIQSVLDSKGALCDLIVVDNASTDDSVMQIQKRFSSQITLLQNTENLGGSGGFNTGLRYAMEHGYPYFMCLDDDAMVDEGAIETLYQYMEEHPVVGMAGARVYHLQMPEYIQQCGMEIDFAHCSVRTIYADRLEDGTLPDVVSCDSVATCAVMVRAEAVCKGVGIMPEDNFIYWDDTEWGHRMHLAGYQTVTLATAKALHQMGAQGKRSNTFVEYYMWRNRLHFFMQYTPKKQWETMSVCALEMIFDAIYTGMLRGAHQKVQTISYALFDAMSGVRGKADAYKILPNDESDEALLAYLQDKHTYCIIPSETEDSATEVWKQDAMYLRNFLAAQRMELEETHLSEAEVVFCLCEDLFHQKEYVSGYVYIDGDRNCILSPEDLEIVQNYTFSKLLFLYMNQGNFLAATQRESRVVK